MRKILFPVTALKTNYLNLFISIIKICYLVCHVACHDWSTWHTVSFFFFFNRYLIEGLKPKVLQRAGTNTKQKKARRPKLKLGESAGTKHTFKPYCFSLNYKMECDSEIIVCSIKSLIVFFLFTFWRWSEF